MQHARPVAVSVALLLTLCVFVHQGHRHVEAWAPQTEVTEAIRFLPSGKALDMIAMGYDELLADLLWVRATVFFGENFGTEQDPGWYSWLYHMLDLATDLDPRFVPAYKYGGVMLRVDGMFVEQSTMMFAKGMEALPGEWYFPFGIAMNYFLYKEDSALAAPYMRQAAKLEGGPFYLANLAATLTDESQGLESALVFLQEEARTLPPGRARNAVEVKIFETRYEIAEQAAATAVATFRRAYGRLPVEPLEVTQAGIALPADPLGGAWQWDRSPDAELGSVISSEYYRVFSEISRSSGLGALGVGNTGGEVGVGLSAPEEEK